MQYARYLFSLATILLSSTTYEEIQVLWLMGCGIMYDAAQLMERTSLFPLSIAMALAHLANFGGSCGKS